MISVWEALRSIFSVNMCAMCRAMVTSPCIALLCIFAEEFLLFGLNLVGGPKEIGCGRGGILVGGKGSFEKFSHGLFCG